MHYLSSHENCSSPAKSIVAEETSESQYWLMPDGSFKLSVFCGVYVGANYFRGKYTNK